MAIPFQIQLTNDPLHFETCASFMAATDPWITLGMSQEQCRAAFEGSFREVYIAVADQQIYGFVILQTTGSFKGYIQTLLVAASARGQGLGTALLKFCEKRILRISPNIFICVSSFNTRAAQLYYRFGFKQVGTLPDFIKKGYTELLLLKSVGPVLDYLPKNK